MQTEEWVQEEMIVIQKEPVEVERTVYRETYKVPMSQVELEARAKLLHGNMCLQIPKKRTTLLPYQYHMHIRSKATMSQTANK